MRVVIAGAGAVGRSVAQELIDNGHTVLLIDKSPSSIRADVVPDAQWLLADACELSSLAEAQLESSDVVIASTGDANLVELTMPEDSPFIGKRVSEVPWPDDVVLVAILRDHSIQTPDSDRSLEAGDELLFVTPEDAEDSLGELLSPKG